MDDEPGLRLTFAQGFVFGQLVLGILLLLLFRQLFMTNVAESIAKQRADLIYRTHALQKSLDKRSKRAAGKRTPYEKAFQERMEDILRHTKYDMEHHAPESLDWLNLMVAQTLHGYRASVWLASRGHSERDADLPLPSLQTEEQTAAKYFVERLLNGVVAGRTMDVLVGRSPHFRLLTQDTITVTDIDFGNAYPVFSNAKFRPAGRMQGLRLEVDVDYVDRISLGLDTKLLLNFPHFRFGSLAIAVCVRIERITGTLGIEIGPKQGTASTQEVRVSLYPDFMLDVHVSSLLGSKNKLQDVPKIEQLLISRLRMAIQQRFVWPHFWSIPLPVLEMES